MPNEQIRGRCAGYDAKAQTRKLRILRTLYGTALVRPVEHDVAREIIRVCGLHDFVAGNRPHYEVTEVSPQRVAHEPDHLRKPRVFYLQTELCAHQLCDLVLEAFLLLVGERKVVGVGTNLELAAIDDVGGLRGARSAHNKQPDKDPGDVE